MKPVLAVACLFISATCFSQLHQKVKIPESARGKEFRFSGYVNTADSTAVEFWAYQQTAKGKFIKDKRKKSKTTRANQQWCRFEVTSRIKDDCAILVIGLWCRKRANQFHIDEFSVEVNNGKTWEPLPMSNPDFELPADSAGKIQKWLTLPGYDVVIDKTTKISGNQSLKVTLTDLVKYGDFAEHGNYITANGVKIYYETYGQGQPLLLLHGNNESISSFNNQIDELKKNYKVIAVDSRGQGKSSMDRQKMTYDLMASDMNALLVHLGQDSVNILGWSDGGNTGLVMAMKYPQRVKSLITMGANLYPNKNAVQKKFLREYRWTIRLVRVLAVLHPNKWKTKLKVGVMVLKYPRIDTAQLKSISVPVLVMAGERDVVNESHTRLIATSIPKSKLVILKGLEHYAPQQDPKMFNKEVVQFLEAPALGSH